MGRTERLFQITGVLRSTQRMRFDELRERLAVSPATLKRDLKYLREQLGTPIEYDAFDRSYKLAGDGTQPRKELPGLWFSEAELHALALAHRLLQELDPQHKLAPRLSSVIRRSEKLLAPGGLRSGWLERIRMVMPGKREVDGHAFEAVALALMQGRQLTLDYRSRSRGVLTQRQVSPQRLVFHRTWFLDAWCHQAQALRRFALDAVQSAQALRAPARELPLPQIETLFDGAYGSFPGQPKRWGTLRFTREAARGIERENWHPLQRIRRLPDGQLELMVPYDDPTELAFDILRHGDQVEVVGDEELVRTVHDRVHGLGAHYPEQRWPGHLVHATP